MTKTPIETLLLQYGNLIEKILTDRGACRGSMLSNALKNASDKDAFAHALIAVLLCSVARAASGLRGATSVIPDKLALIHQGSDAPPLTGPEDPVASSELQRFMADFQAALIPLPNCVADSFNHCLLSLLESARLEFTDSGHVVTGGASRGGVVLRIFGARELLAAALAAA